MSINNQILGTIAQIATYDNVNGRVIGLTVTGNLAGNYIIGNGAFLTGVTAYTNANVATYLASNSNVTITTGIANITTQGNISANYFLGNGAFITGLPAQYSNANVLSYLASNANVTITAGISNISTQGNIVGNYLLGNGAFITGVTAYTNANVSSYLASNSNVTITAGIANITTQGNISGNYFLGNGAFITGLPGTYSNANVATYLASNSNVTITTGIANITTQGNITGNYFTVSNSLILQSSYANTVFGSNTVVDTWPIATYTTAEYNYRWIQTANSANAQFGKLLVSTDGTNGYIVIYGVGGSVTSEQILFTATQTTGIITVSANAISATASATVKISKQYTTI